MLLPAPRTKATLARRAGPGRDDRGRSPINLRRDAVGCYWKIGTLFRKNGLRRLSLVAYRISEACPLQDDRPLRVLFVRTLRCASDRARRVISNPIPMPLRLHILLRYGLGVTCVCCADGGFAADSSWVYRGDSGRLVYTPDAQGDRVPDFSDVGYLGGRSPVPTVQTAITLSPVSGDDTASIQAAIDQVSALPLGSDGFRGAVLLGAGDYEVSGQLTISASGVVLRGSEKDASGTALHATPSAPPPIWPRTATTTSSSTPETTRSGDPVTRRRPPQRRCRRLLPRFPNLLLQS
ncbi:hypothetical protein Pla175_18150 [Pirellulimonas nuda]|uniref:Pectate lyase superfamily protein n=1 Tax=Pirellulimonas nuda TaxID=2528009 RepID=A0A518DAC1_9BACT|nr:hypothetical protein Pla175_18150 [Pirellulimonas nuda]